MSNKAEPMYRAAIAATFSPEIIGVDQLDNPAWEKAQAVRIEKYWSGELAPGHRHAEARILWSDESLSVRFIGRQTEPLIVNSNPQIHQKTLGLWNKDVCEIFLLPNPDKPQRY